MILSWFENYLSEEIPPETLWDDAEAIELHFQKVKDKKDAEREGMRISDKDDFVEGDAMSNDLASVFKR